VIIGFASGDDKKEAYPTNDPTGLGSFAVSLHNAFTMTAGEKALVGGVLMGVGGTLTGMVIGAVAKKKFIIGGKKEKYRDLEGELRRRLVLR